MNINELIGLTLTKVEQRDGNSEIVFETEDGKRYLMYHSQDCCESVRIEDIIGDLKDLIGSPLLMAEESTSDKDPEDVKAPEFSRDSFTWTFYRFATRKGYVTIRWLGESNGYYSESVSFEEEAKAWR